MSSSSSSKDEGSFDKAFVVKQFPKDMKMMFDSKLNMLYGTTVSMVVSAFLKALSAARASGDSSKLMVDMVFSVFVSQTVSREWARQYSMLGSTTMFKQFEITGNRVADSKTPASMWVSTSSMNATAVGILGHLIMSVSDKRTSLGRKAEEIGTIFDPKDPDEFPNSEYVKICNATKMTLSVADMNAQKVFKTHATHLVSVVEDLLEGSSSNLDEALATLPPMNKF